MMQNMQGLPFPPNQVVSPQVAGPQYQVQASAPQFQQLIAPATVAVINTLQRHGSKNALRVFLFNQLTCNNFQNNDFVKVVNAVAEFAAFQMSTNQQFGANPQAAVDAAAESFCAMMASVNAKTYQALYGYIDQATAADVEQKVAEFMRFQQVMQQWKQQMMQPQMMQQQAPVVQNPWAGQQNGMVGVQQGQPWNSWQQTKPSNPIDMAANAFKPMGRPVETFTAGHGVVQGLNLNANQQGFAAFATGAFAAPQESVQAPVADRPSSVTFGFRGKGKGREEVAAPVAAVTPVQAPVADDDASLKAELSTMVRDEFYIDGCPVRHCTTTEWAPTSTLENPYPTAYSPETHACFLQRHPSGEVEEIILPLEDLTPEMEYAQHELKASFNHQTKLDVDSGKIVIPNWTAVEKLESKTATEAVVEDGVEINPLIVRNRIDAPNLELAELHARVELAGNGVSSYYEDAIEFYYDENLVFGSELKNMVELFDEVWAGETAEEIQARFVKLKGVIPDRVWYSLNQRATKALNTLTTVNLQMSMNVDSFADDLAELVKVVDEERGKIFSVALEEGLRDMVKRVFNLKDVEYSDGIPEGIYTYALTTGRSVTIVDWPSTAISAQIKRTGSSIKESYTPALYRAVAGILARAEEVGNIHEHLIVTKDNVILKVERGLIGRDNIVVSFE